MCTLALVFAGSVCLNVCLLMLCSQPKFLCGITHIIKIAAMSENVPSAKIQISRCDQDLHQTHIAFLIVKDAKFLRADGENCAN